MFATNGSTSLPRGHVVSPQRGTLGVEDLPGTRHRLDLCQTCQVVKLCPRHYNISRVIRHWDTNQFSQGRVLWLHGSSISEFFDEGREWRMVPSDV